ncbi:type VI secretion system lipoprotein TssJ [Pseudomonas aestusnigri]|jgi:type VI secretion system protein VasD|uniref:type VI secretion system lipoprotein TssJ n=1 Tax=Halopseudomonas aestusnigri TaxID=857252 RepID=UPI001D186467|nr:type VI secretion system lipoprotein TssJ [Halopseudomonas aestusnigri]MCC4261970.1 type VI secretion system lipoprotein TssJ [Halopseudomonas aestusnigri]
MPLAQLLLTIAACTLLSACSLISPYSDLTKLDLTLHTSDQLNPDLNGRPSPLVLQLVELSHATAFEQADYFDLQQRPATVLAPDLLAMEELELRPGEQRTLKLALQPDTRHVGLVASYRDLGAARWRLTLDLAPRQRNTVRLHLDNNGLHLPAGDGAP